MLSEKLSYPGQYRAFAKRAWKGVGAISAVGADLDAFTRSPKSKVTNEKATARRGMAN